MKIGNLKQWGIEEHAYYQAIPKMAEDACKWKPRQQSEDTNLTRVNGVI